MSDTIRKLSEMTEESAFERLATAILREARPEYSSLLHPGVNSEGKTVKGPVDGIAFVLGAKPCHLIAAHHTTCGFSMWTLLPQVALASVPARVPVGKKRHTLCTPCVRGCVIHELIVEWRPDRPSAVVS
jgi:hypothetical protein